MYFVVFSACERANEVGAYDEICEPTTFGATQLLETVCCPSPQLTIFAQIRNLTNLQYLRRNACALWFALRESLASIGQMELCA